jgi:hypothetical protein
MSTTRKSTKRSSVIVQKGRSAKGRSETSEGAPGKSASASRGEPAKGGKGGSAKAEGGSAAAGSVKVQTTQS